MLDTNNHHVSPFYQNPPVKIASYILGKTLGVGSFGKVKLAEHEQTVCESFLLQLQLIRYRAKKSP